MRHPPERPAGRLPSGDGHVRKNTLVVRPEDRSVSGTPLALRSGERAVLRIVYCARDGYPSHRTACDEPARAHLLSGRGRSLYDPGAKAETPSS